MLKRYLCAFLVACMLTGVVVPAPVSAQESTETTDSSVPTQTVQAESEQTETTESTEQTQTEASTEATMETEATEASTEATEAPTEATNPPEPVDDRPVIKPVYNETRTSQELIDLLKEFEGFVARPYKDGNQYSIGYGTECPADVKAYADTHPEYGITTEEAEYLMMNHINGKAGHVDIFLKKYGLEVNQHEYDGLVIFTYNSGIAWLNNEVYKAKYGADHLLHLALRDGISGDDLIYYFVIYCKPTLVFSNAMIERRMCEANIYLNGSYQRRPPENYSFVRFDINGGVIDHAVQAYNIHTPTDFKVVVQPTYTGSDGTVYEFEGWYTARKGGTRIEKLDYQQYRSELRYGVTLYAHWKVIKEGTGTPGDSGSSGTATLVDVLVTAKSLNIRTGPGTEYTVKGSYPKDTQLTIVEVQNGTGGLWGRVANTGNPGYWVCLDYTNYDTVIRENESTTPPTTEAPTVPPTTQTPTVPPTTQTPTVPPTTEAPTVPPTTQAPTVPPTTEAPTVPPTTEVPTVPDTSVEEGSWTGKVVVNTRLIVRANAGTYYKIVGYLYNGDTVTVTQKKTVDGVEWGYIGKGWISLKYVDFSTEPAPTDPPVTEPAPTEPPTTAPAPTEPPATEPAPTEPPVTMPPTTEPPVTNPPETQPPVTSPPETQPPVTQPAPTEPPATEFAPTEPAVPVIPTVPTVPDGEGYWVGTVISPTPLQIYHGPDATYGIAGYFEVEQRILITERKTVSQILWGLTERGWIRLDYVAVDGELQDEEDLLYTVNSCSLRVRDVADGTGTIVTFYSRGDRVQILEQEFAGNTLWGRTELGWINMKYLA